MFTRILRHEWRMLTSDATVWIITAVCTVAVGYGVWNGSRWVAFQRQALTEAAAEEGDRYALLRRQIDDLQVSGAKVSPFADPRSPTNVGGRLGPRYAMLPPAPLAPLAIGQSDLLPYYFKVSTDARENIVSTTEIENPNRLLAGRFDLAFVIIFFFPLLIIALTYNMLSVEKEQGTLAMVLSQPVAARTLVLGKIAVRAALLIGIIVALSTGAVVAVDVDLSAPGATAQLALWISVVTVYAAFWFALSLFVCSLGRSSTANATILATTWLALVVMAPALFNLVATSLYPVPSRVEMVQAVREASDAANKEGSKLLARYYEDHPELATGDADQAMTDFNVVRVAVNDDIERRVRPVIGQYDERIGQQQRMLERLRILSPAILMQGALNDISGTGTERHQYFLRQVDAFHEAWRRHFVPLIFAKSRLLSLEAVPAFSYIEEPLAAVRGRVGMSAVVLLFGAAILTAVGLIRLPRFPVVG